MRHPQVKTIAIAFLLPGIAAILSACSEPETARAQNAPHQATSVSVTVAPARADVAPRAVEVVGTLHGDEEATISAKVAGRIVAIHHDVGDRVQPGQPLAQIETRDYELARTQRQLAMREALAKLGLRELPPEGQFDPDTLPTVRKARLEAQNAEARFNRGRQLYEQQPPRLSEQEFADLQTAWEVAQTEYQVQVLTARTTLEAARARHAELEQVEQQLADTTVRAPTLAELPSAEATSPAATAPAAPSREYAITARLVSVGEFVSIATALFRVVDDDPIKLRCDIPEQFAGEVRVGQPVRVAVDAFRDRTFAGTISRINPQIDPSTRSFRIEALLDNPDRLLMPGAFARVSIQTRREENVVFVPTSAVVTFAGVNRVYVVTDGKADERIVELGQRRDGEVEVRRGVSSGETVVVSGGEKLTAGTPLSVSTSAPQ